MKDEVSYVASHQESEESIRECWDSVANRVRRDSDADEVEERDARSVWLSWNMEFIIRSRCCHASLNDANSSG